STSTTWRSYCSRSRPLDGIMRASSPRRCASSSPGAPGRLQMTTAISAGIRPDATLSAMAMKLEPRPESSIPRRCFCEPDIADSCQELCEHHAAATLGDLADLMIRLPEAAQNLLCPGQVALPDDQRHADAAIERAPHVRFGHAADLLQQGKDGGFGPLAC